MENAEAENHGWITSVAAGFLTLLEVIFYNESNIFKEITEILPNYKQLLLANSISLVGIWAVNRLICVFVRNKFIKIKRVNVKKAFVPVFVVISMVLCLSVSAELINNADTVEPTINISQPSTALIQSRQFEQTLSYTVYFDDDTKIKKVNLDAEHVCLNGFSASVSIEKLDENKYIVVLSNIQGEIGRQNISILKGAAVDLSNNKTPEVTSGSFLLYNDPADIDSAKPVVSISGLTSIVSNDEIALEITLEEDNPFTFGFSENDVILLGFNANINVNMVEGKGNIVLSDFSDYHSNKPCKIILSKGIATDGWKNKSDVVVSEDFYIKKDTNE